LSRHTIFSSVFVSYELVLIVGVAYLTCDLRTLRASAPELDGSARERIDHLGIQRQPRRGCRAGRLVRLRRNAKSKVRRGFHPGRRPGKTVFRYASLQPVGNGAFVISSNRPPVRRCRTTECDRTLTDVPVVHERHAKPLGHVLSFASMNVRSLSPSKLDNLLLELNDRPVDVMLLCETWHDADSVAIRRLRADESLSVNHGGVAIVAAAGVVCHQSTSDDN